MLGTLGMLKETYNLEIINYNKNISVLDCFPTILKNKRNTYFFGSMMKIVFAIEKKTVYRDLFC